MSKKVLVNLNMSKNQIENAAAHNLPSAPDNPVVGQEYFNTSDKQKYIWNGTAWVSETAQGTTYTEGTGIDISGNVISADFTAVATAAQGTLADTALQPNDNISELTNDAGYITNSALSGYVPTSRTVNGKALTSNITLDFTDVGALSSSTTINDLTTTAQQAALNSGATTTNIGQIATNTSAISTINGKIPSQASSSNQLADKAFVNSSIATSTATFRGTFGSVAELEAYTGPKDDNDYAFVTGTDAEGNTYYDRYKYNGTAWVFEYRLNNSSFTSAQWAAINSGATSTNISQIGTIQSTINGYGNIVTHNTSEFATAAQGTKADSAAQTYTITNPALTQTGGVCTWTVTHNLGANVVASVYDATTNEEVIVTVEKTSSTVATVKINSTANIASGAYRVVVIGK
jgi:hypothetical protein